MTQDTSLFYMDEYTPYIDIHGTYVQFAQQHLQTGADQSDLYARFPQEKWQALADAGFWQTLVPDGFGGRGTDYRAFFASFEGLSSQCHDFGLLLSIIAHAGLIQVLVDHGTFEQKQKYLPLLMGGGVGSTAATEPQGGSHISAVKTRAAQSGDATYLLSGEKCYITNAPIADVMLIVGRLAGLEPRDITLFVVGRDQAGVRRGNQDDLLGQRSSPTGPIYLDGVEITPAHIVGQPGEGLETLYNFLAFDRLMYAIAVSGYLKPFIGDAIAYAQDRTAFGQPLISHGFIQDKIVQMVMTQEISASLAEQAATHFCDRSMRAQYYASMAKLYCAENLVTSALELIQLFGHKGYQKGSRYERLLRDAVALRIAGGTSEMQKKNVVKFAAMFHRQSAGSA
ncbi:acyl-CoA dehydrogenase [Deinococcus sp. HMF7620]|uniref:Acyl-CoA dehydrogenase n=1 Tax=Deinococcus arboris TaxID=2682977 RepID=A0A7C9M999_9DEIO|nr:acyl-CoA dehydrogenase family protein [Deinococcus arboris]MVN89225.1 acyl-CoA dehydrogenase [Deinococcus arboris]